MADLNTELLKEILSTTQNCLQRLANLDVRVQNVESEVHSLVTVIHKGNGKEAITTRLTVVETNVAGIKEDQDAIRGDLAAIKTVIERPAAPRSDSESKAMAKREEDGEKEATVWDKKTISALSGAIVTFLMAAAALLLTLAGKK